MAHERFSEQIRRLSRDPGATAWEIQDKAATMAENGTRVVFLTVGDPDFGTPVAIIEEAVARLQAQRTKYSPVLGEPALRRAVAVKEGRRFGRPISPDNVVVFPGAQNALFNIMAALVGEGDSVLVAEPYYATYPGVIAATGARLKPVRTDPQKGFALSPADLEAAITPDVRAILINSPANPTGAILDAETLRQIDEICERYGIWLISDEVYADFVYDGPSVSFGQITTSLNRTVVINSLSKSLAMTGWRIGWAVVPEDLCRHLEPLLSAQLFGVPQFLQDAATWAIKNEQPETAQMREQYKDRRDVVIEELSGARGIECILPGGGMFVMAEVSRCMADGLTFAFALLDDKHIAVVPGFGFGESASGYVRISLTQPVDILRDACRKICAFVDQKVDA